jgi:hypothetical protein
LTTPVDIVRRFYDALGRGDVPPLHSITSSARARIGSGIVNPIALAVLRLRIRTYLKIADYCRSDINVE